MGHVPSLCVLYTNVWERIGERHLSCIGRGSGDVST